MWASFGLFANPAIVRQIQKLVDRPFPEAGRFVILLHEMPANSDRLSHWDLLLEAPEGLLCWELPIQNLEEIIHNFNGRRDISARRLPDHRSAYLEYEGPIAGNRGQVSRIESGQYCLTKADLGMTIELSGSHWQFCIKASPDFLATKEENVRFSVSIARAS